MFRPSLAPTIFEWSAASNDFAQQQVSPEKPFPDSVRFEGMKFGDVDGDGRPDMVWLNDGLNGSACPTELVHVSFAGQRSGAFGYYRASLGGTCTPMEMGNEDRHWFLLDYDGDGRDDLFITGENGWVLYPSRGYVTSGQPFDSSRNLIAGLSPAIPKGPGPQLADLNGDGLLDVIYPRDRELYVRLAERGAGGFAWGAERRVNTNGVVSSQCRQAYECDLTPLVPSVPGKIQALVDFNGDARSDLLYQVSIETRSPTGNCQIQRASSFDCEIIQRSTWLHAMIVERITTSEVSLRSVASWQTEYREQVPGNLGPLLNVYMDRVSPADINGDGLTDLVYRAGPNDNAPWRYLVNTGAGFTDPQLIQATDAASRLPNGDHLQVVDVTGDGRADLVVPASNYRNYNVLPALPSIGFGAPRSIGSTLLINCSDNCLGRQVQMFIDVDGDGAVDFIKVRLRNASGDTAVFQEFARPSLRYTPRDVITAVTNGFGARTEITYRPLTLSGVHRRPLTASRNALNWGRGSAVQDLLAPMYVVTEVSSSAPTASNANARSRVLYQYFEGRMQGGGRGFLGFRGVFTYDLNRPGGQHVLSRDYFHQAYPFNGLPEQSLKQVVNGAPAIAVDTRSGLRSPFSAECRSTTPEDYCFLRPESANYPDPGFGGNFVYNLSVLESVPAFAPGSAVPLQVRPQRTEDYNGGYESGPTAKVVTAFQYDAWGNPTRTEVSTFTWPGNVLQGAVITTASYTNDGARWRLGRLTESSVTHTRSGKPSITRSTRFAYAMDGAVTGLLNREQIQPGGGAAFDRRTLYDLDAYGNRIASYTCSSDLTDAACRAGITAFRPESETRVHRYSKVVFDALGRYPVRVLEPFWNASNNAGSERTVLEVLSRNVHGDITAQRDVNGVQEQRAYGSFGRPYYAWVQTLPNATLGNTAQGLESLVSYRWCAGHAPAGQPAVSCPTGAVFREQSVTEGAPTKWVYHDRLGRAMATVTESLQWNLTGRQFAVTCTYWDAAGLEERRSQPAFLGTAASNGEPVFPAGACPGGAWTTLAYDAQGRLVRTSTPHVAGQDSVVMHQYNGLVGTTVDPRGHSVVEERNPFGEILRVTDGVGSTAVYDYDAAGALLTVTRDAGRGAVQSRFTYDVLGRKTSQTDPDTGTWTYAYNAMGELVRTVSAKGVTKLDRYDARGRLFRHTVTPAGASVPEFEDRIEHDQGTGALGKAHRSCRWRPNAANVLVEDQCETHTFDALGRLVEQSSRIAGTDWTIERRVYDALGRVVERRDATGRWLRTEFGAKGHALRLCEGNGSGLSNCVPGAAETYHEVLEVDPRGQVTVEKRGAAYVQRSFDLIGRLIEQKAGPSLGSGSAQWERYGYDLAGNLDFRERVGHFKERFAYDGADRLTRSWWESFGGVVYGASAPDENAVNSVEVMRFDAFGNLCSQRSTGAQWVYGGRAGCGTGGLPGGGNSGTEVGAHQARELRVGAVVIPIQFDANGNQHRALMNGAVVKGWEYDGDDRSTAVWKGTSAAAATRLTRFENGVGGGRVRRIDGGSTYGMPRTTTYLGSVERVERNGVITWRRHIAGIAVQTLAGASPVPNHTRYLLQDLLGSAVAVVDAGGSVVERSHYSVYGARQAGEQFGSGIQTTERGFTGHEQVDDLETVHMGARVYDPTAGRFLQPDPLVQQVYRPQNWNPYAYAWNNPLRFTDPTGMFNVGRALQMLGTVLQIAAIFIPGLAMVMPMISQFLSYANIAIGFAQGGVRGGLAACFGAFVGGGGGGLGGFVSGLAVGGVSSVIAGGRFKQGVLGSLKSQAVGTALQAMGGAYRSRQTGGKQANGAETATQARVNDAAPELQERSDPEEIANVKRAFYKEAQGVFDGLARERFDTEDAAATRWQDVIDPIARKHDTEAVSMISVDRHGKFYLDGLYSDGMRKVAGNFRPFVHDGVRGFVHNHPSHAPLSPNDLEIASSVGRQLYGSIPDVSSRWDYSGFPHQTAYASSRGGALYAWSTRQMWVSPQSDWSHYEQRRVR